jgi:hypothetical protein
MLLIYNHLLILIICMKNIQSSSNCLKLMPIVNKFDFLIPIGRFIFDFVKKALLIRVLRQNHFV